MQAAEENTITEHRKKRSQSEKVGRLKHIIQLEWRILDRLNVIGLEVRTIFKGLQGSFNFTKPLIQKIACRDEVDLEILDLLFQNQPEGLFPKDVAARLAQFRLNRFHVSRRLKAMNRRLEKELGQHVAEKHGHHWALTSFAVEAWGETEKQSEGGEN